VFAGGAPDKIARVRPGRRFKIDDVWIVWAKKASPLYSGMTQADVRGPGMARGFVDFKVCAIDETWSGLRFKRRR
jgi:hypothetical protein